MTNEMKALIETARQMVERDAPEQELEPVQDAICEQCKKEPKTDECALAIVIRDSMMGQLAELVDMIADDLKQEEILQKDKTIINAKKTN
jgi:hypothetical protein